MPEPIYVIGIDLGTTNSIAAYAPVDSGGQPPDIQVMRIPQLVSAGTMEKRDILPSFIFLPGSGDMSTGALSLPWDLDNRFIVGEYARERGAEIPQRLISSAKSWLCNTMVDRNSPLLPWDAPAELNRMSPVEASAAILRYIRDVWNHRMATGDDHARMEHQEIFLTVPASFDAVARELTVKAAQMAGLENFVLLEEPQAAFYAWIAASGKQWRKAVKNGDLILVCDVGGGTSDFSLIRVSEQEGDLLLERIAVGNHLLVGGDNMDLTLAYHIARKVAEKGTRLDGWQMRGLIHSCRNAKEQILSDPEIAEYPVTILGRGSSLIGGILKTDLPRDEMEKVILDGFFPEAVLTDTPRQSTRIGLQEAGLSYESDPAITRHLAQFLNRQQKNGRADSILPTHVLFNGGVMKSAFLRNRFLNILAGWRSAEAAPLREIGTNEFDLAVARGAAYFGIARKGKGIRIRGGLGKSYYVGIAAAMPSVPGMPTPVKALCVAPFGMEEGTSANLTRQEFNLVVGESVRFDFLGSSVRKEDEIGMVIEDWEGDIQEITTLETTLDGRAGETRRVTLEVRITDIGTLELWCVSVEDGGRWKLEFNVREQ